MDQKDQLFVKLEGHEELMQELHSINHIVKNIEEASDLLEEIREIKQKTIKNMQENILELNQRIESINNEMPNVDDGEMQADISPETPEQDVQIDESVSDLHNQLETLKDELNQLE